MELRSRKFRLLLYDVIVSLILFFGAKYLQPEIFTDVKFVIAAIQPVVIAVIAGIAYEDGQAKRGGLLTAPSSSFRDRVYGADELP